MQSSIQRWLANPLNARWEQPSYDSLAMLDCSSALLRRKQAMALFEHDVFSICQRISPLMWAKRYVHLAFPLVNAFPNVFDTIDDSRLDLQWLAQVARFPRTEWHDSPKRLGAAQSAQTLLQRLGHEHVLSKAFAHVLVVDDHQIAFWRDTFPNEPLHEKMGIAMQLGHVRRNDLDGYLRARRPLLTQEIYDPVDLSLLDLDNPE